MNQETKVGLFLLAALGAILTSILMLGNVQLFKHTTRYYLDFTNVEALPAKAAVKVAGVEIGKVRRVGLIDGHARVAIDVDPKIKFYSNTKAKIGSTGIIGSKFVEVDPGTPDTGVLSDGAVIQGQSSQSLDQMVARLSTLFDNDEKYGNSITNLKETIANIRNVSRALNVAMGEHSQEMEEIVMNVRDLTASAKIFTAHLAEITTERKEDFKVAIEKFRGVGEKLDLLLAKINRGEGVMGALVADDKAGRDVKEAVASIKDTANSAKKVLGRFTNINVYWDYRYRYDFRDNENKSDVGLTFVPRPGKFYMFGVQNIGDPVPNEKYNSFERKTRFTAVLGQEFGPFTGYAGAIRTDAGFGINFRPLYKNPKWNRRFELTAEAADFKRDRMVNGEHLNKAWVAGGAHVAVNKWLWLGARVEDIFEHAAFQAYTNIVFRDEDLSYFFGFASLAR